MSLSSLRHGRPPKAGELSAREVRQLLDEEEARYDDERWDFDSWDYWGDDEAPWDRREIAPSTVPLLDRLLWLPLTRLLNAGRGVLRRTPKPDRREAAR